MKTRVVCFGGMFVLMLALAACHTPSGKPENGQKKNLTQKQLIDFNRKLLRREKKEIDAFIKAKHWKMKETGTGLRYQILSVTQGAQARTGENETIRYSVRLLNGKAVYEGMKTFQIGFGGVASGLEEGILLMKKGEVARFVLPSHLAYGLSGDGNKIPPHTPIIYHVELLQLK